MEFHKRPCDTCHVKIPAKEFRYSSKNNHPDEDRKNMPKIFYFLKQKRRYFPDIYIPHLNKIIKVKSTYTFEKEYIKNMMKSLETKKNFDYEIWIYDEINKKIIYF